MPEVVEIEFLKNEVASTLSNKEVAGATLLNEKISNLKGAEFENILVGKTLLSTDRHGKILILNFSSDYRLLIHFLITGYMKLITEEENKAQAVLKFNDGNTLGIFGIMKPGFIKIYKAKDLKEIEEIKELGVDVLSKEFTFEKFKQILEENAKKSIKDILISQEIIAGLGNAYSDEILFESKIHPKRKAKELKEEEKEILFKNIFKIIEEGKKYGGASELSFVHLDGRKGEFHKHFKVHKREGEKCLVCGTSIETISIGGRTSYFCPNCQR